MTTKPLARFWQALEDIPEATADRREWSLRLKDDWPEVVSYLTETGRLAGEIACPSPGDDGCPRKVVKHGDGRYRAVCGNKPAECDPIELTVEEITYVTLDRKKLASAVCKILDAVPEPYVRPQRSVSFVGSHGVAAGLEIPVILLIPGPMTEVSLATLPDSDRPSAILIPTPGSIPNEIRMSLRAAGHHVLALNDICCLDSKHRLVGVQPADVLLATLREKLLASRAPKKSGRAWNLPAGTRWENVTFEFIAKEVLLVKVRGQPTRRIEPDQFGMKSKHSGKPTGAWTLLRSIVHRRGELTWTPSKTVSVRRQKQILSRKLVELFGIKDDPLPAGPGESYVARFSTIYSVRTLKTDDNEVSS